MELCAQLFDGKCFNVDLDEYVQNRAYYITVINPELNREIASVDTQIILTFNFDSSSLVA